MKTVGALSTDNKMMRCKIDNSEDMLVIYRTSAPQIYEENWDQPVVKMIKMQWRTPNLERILVVVDIHPHLGLLLDVSVFVDLAFTVACALFLLSKQLNGFGSPRIPCKIANS